MEREPYVADLKRSLSADSLARLKSNVGTTEDHKCAYSVSDVRYPRINRNR